MPAYLLRLFGRPLARYLSKPSKHYAPVAMMPARHMAAMLLPGDVLLIEGSSRVSVAIKYLTQSTWSHAALYLGAEARAKTGHDMPMFIEADMQEGVRLVPLTRYEHAHTRICRPLGLSPDDVQRLIADALTHIGQTYDLRNLFDLARYLLPTPPVPTHWRRRMIALGSSDPTKAICSSLIATLFQNIRYPILPDIEQVPEEHPGRDAFCAEILHIRSSSLYAPRDFDISPYFQIIKPDLPAGFDYRTLRWDEPYELKRK